MINFMACFGKSDVLTTLCDWKNILLILALFNSILSKTKSVEAKVFTRCELAMVLKKELSAAEFINYSEWICKAEGASGLDSTKHDVNVGIRAYGIFQIVSPFWCRDGGFGSIKDFANGCGLNCSSLLDDDITDDIQCAIKIKKEESFKVWTPWAGYCHQMNMFDYIYIENCSVTPQPPNARNTTRCNLANELQTYLPKEELTNIGNWLCLVEAISRLQIHTIKTSEMDADETSGETLALTRSYGLFGIDNRWCEDESLAAIPNYNYVCNMKCVSLLNTDLRDDIECALKIQNLNSFHHWEAWQETCFEENIHEYMYIDNCTSSPMSMGRNLTRCEFAIELRKHLTSEEFDQHVGDWICVAEAGSGLTTAFVRPTNGRGASQAIEYGIFGMPNTGWCDDGSSRTNEFVNGCNLNCSQLTDEDLGDDIECALKITLSEFSGWRQGTSLCKDMDLVEYKYLKDCPVSPIPVKPEINSTKLRIIFMEGSRDQYIDCNGSVKPLPVMEWGDIREKYTDLISILLDGNTTLRLIFPMVRSYHEGLYKCSAKNAFGYAEEIFKLTVIPPMNSVNHSKHESSTNYLVVVGVPIAIVCIVVIIVVSIVYYLRLLLLSLNGLSNAEISEFIHGCPSKIAAGQEGEENAQHLPYNKDYDLPKSKLSFNNSKVLGEGQYGIVTKAEFDGKTVVVKTVKPPPDKLYIKALLSELKIMIYLGEHTNFVSLIGGVTNELDKGNLMMVVEFCELGDLQNYLKNHKDDFVGNRSIELENCQTTPRYCQIVRPITTSHLIVWCHQIATGMSYLETRKVIHGDLAARNVLLTCNYTVKITDFGLARQTFNYMNYVKKEQVPLPWRHMAVESLQNMEFSSMSDAWAFGITMWEIFSFGDVPYGGRSWSPDFLKDLQQGLRLAQPQYAPDMIYETMKKCWALIQFERPLFKSCHST